VSATTLAGYLAGEDGNAYEKTGLNRFSTYGILKDLGMNKTSLVVHRMEKYGMLIENEDHYRTIALKDDATSESNCKLLYSSLIAED
jgi:superfamily II DNA helicase RecQ